MLAPSFLVPGAYAAPANELKLAVIGCGGRGTGAVFQAFETGHPIKLVAMADAFQDRLDSSYKAIFDKYGKDKVDVPVEKRFVGFDGYKKAMAEADVVILAAPPGFRPSHFEEAVNQGKQIFAEKPMATDAAGIRKVLAAAEVAKTKKLNVVVGLQRHYQSNYREVMKRVHNGDLGEIVGGQVYWNDGGVWVRERKPGQTEMEFFSKNAYPIKAEGTGGRAVRTGKDHGEIFDHHVLTFTYADGSVIHSECRHFPGAANRVDETFQGTKGKVFLSAGNHGIMTDWKGNALYTHDRENQPNPYQVEHDELWATLVKGEYKFADAENAAKSTLTAIMGRYATYSGKVLTWDEALNGSVDLFPDTLAWDAMPKVLPGSDGYYPYAIPGKTKVV